MPDEAFTRQPDGRLVAGPGLDLGPPDTGASPGKWVAVAAGLSLVLAAGIFLGRTAFAASRPEPTWQALVAQRLYDGCIPAVSVVGVGPTAQTDQINDGLSRTAGAVRSIVRDAHYIQSNIYRVPPDSRLLEVNPKAEVIGVVTYERCL